MPGCGLPQVVMPGRPGFWQLLPDSVTYYEYRPRVLDLVCFEQWETRYTLAEDQEKATMALTNENGILEQERAIQSTIKVMLYTYSKDGFKNNFNYRW